LLFQEKETTTSLRFRLDFDGAEKGEYPNELKFSGSDILALPVINKVYDENNLKRYMEISKFRAAISITQTNDQLRLLELKYGAKLADKKLTLEERERLEAAFLEEKKNLLSAPIYDLTFFWGNKVYSIPSSLTAKVLSDILSAWAEYADRVKGVNQYNIALVSRNILRKEDVQTNPLLLVVDMLRTAIKRILEDTEKLQDIPSANTFKLGGNGVSLSDLRYRILDIQNFKLRTLDGLVRTAGIIAQKEFVKGYLENRILTLKLREKDAKESIAVYEDAMDKYLQGAQGRVIVDNADMKQPSASGGLSSPAMIPQFGETVFNSIMKLAHENQDTEFRQTITKKIIDTGLERVNISSEVNYYEMLYDWLKEPASTTNTSSPAVTTSEITDKIVEEIFNAIMQAIDDLNAIYKGLGKEGLNQPEALLYRVTEPARISVERPITAKKCVTYAVFAWILAEASILFSVLIVNALKKPASL
ncbi:MAG: hypothetical protein V1753_05920, partial [Pseudomonadota bacterium]